MPSISYAITACNEHKELEWLLDMLDKHIRDEDEIVVQLDTTATIEVKQVAEKYNVGTRYEYHRIFFGLNKDFASFKNNLKNHCTRDYIFQIDADEYPHPLLLLSLSQILEYNSSIDVFLVPRINTVEGLTEQHIKQWGWQLNEKGWVNFPDWQMRLYRNCDWVKWDGLLHSKIEGHKTYVFLPAEELFCILHPKQLERQVAQNDLYDKIEQTGRTKYKV